MDIKELINEVKNKTDIIEIISRHVQLKKIGNKYSGVCPFHKDTNPSLIVYPLSRSWFCFGCETGGDIYDFLKRIENISFYEALKKLGERLHIDIGDRRNFKSIDIEEFKKEKLDKVLRNLMLYFLKNPIKAREYLDTERRITPDTTKQFRIGWGNIQSKDSIVNYLLSSGFSIEDLKYYPFLNNERFFEDSIIYPLLDTKGRIQNLISGSVNGRNPKYLFLGGLNKGIYNLHKVLMSEGAVYITEGTIDCLTLEQQGLNAIATLGVHLSPEAKEEITILKDRDIFIVFDNDEAGRTGTFNLCELFPHAKVILFPDSDKKIDPNSYFKDHTIDDFKNLEVKDGLDYRVEYILTLSSDKRTEAIKSLFPAIKTKNEIEKAHYQKLFEKNFNLNRQAFKALLNDIEITEIEREEKEGKVIEIIEDQFEQISPALDFKREKAYVAIPLPSKIRLKEKEYIQYRNYLISSDRDRVELTQDNLFRRKYYAENLELNLPKRWSVASVGNYLKGNYSVSIEDVYKQIRNVLKEYVDLAHDSFYPIITVWLIGTYFHKLFNCYGFLFCNGLKETGKTKLLSICAQIAFNGTLSSNISPSSIFRSISSEHCSLFIDEVENLNKTDLQELRSVLLSSYKQGATVKRTEINGNKVRVVNYQTYSPKALGNISGSDDVIASRSILIPMFRSTNSEVVNKEVLFNDPIFQSIRDSLYLCLMTYHNEVQNIYNKMTTNIFYGRYWEIIRPLLTIAKIINKDVYEEVHDFFSRLQAEREHSVQEIDLDSKVFFAMANLLRERKNPDGKLYIDTRSILNYFRDSEDTELMDIQGSPFGKIINRLGIAVSKKIKVIKGRHVLVYEFDVEKMKSMAEKLRLKVFL